ncbi:MAG: Hsp70 family protein, partial [Methanoculleaceae archaeon]
LIYSAEKLLKDNAGTIDADDRKKVEDGIASLRSALEGDDIQAIKSAHESLQEAVFAVTTKIYQQTQKAESAGTEGASASAAGNDDTVVDADFEVKDS